MSSGAVLVGKIFVVSFDYLLWCCFEEVNAAADCAGVAAFEGANVDALMHAFPGIVGLDGEETFPGDGHDPLLVIGTAQ